VFKCASSTPRESLAANMLGADERIVIARLFVSQDPQERKKHRMNLASK